MIWVLLICALLAYFYVNTKKKQSFWERKGIAYKKPRFFLGNVTISRSKSIAELIQDVYNEFSEDRYFGTYQVLQPYITLRDPDLIKQITVKEFDHFVDHRNRRAAISPDLDPFWNKNLFASEGERWRDLRSTLTPSFTSGKMRIMYTLIDECAQQFVEHFKNEGSGVIELEMKDTLSRYTNDVIATAAFGLKCDSLKDKDNQFYLMGKDASNFASGLRLLKFAAAAISPTMCRLFKVRIIPINVANYFSQIIEDTVKIREEQNIIRPDMIHLLMEARKGRQHQKQDPKIDEGFASISESDLIKGRHKEELTIEDITSQAFLFFLAGFDTVSVLLNFAFYEIAINPDVQDKLRKEIEGVSGKITYEALLGMKYLDTVVSETLRKWPPAILTDRRVTKAFTIRPERPGEKALDLEVGMHCTIPIYSIHRDAKFYPNPEKFDPERFSDENKHKINQAAFLPFGAGPRACIGSRFALLETKLIIFHVLKNFEVVPVEKTAIPMVLDTQQVNLTAKGGMWLGLKKIN